MNSRAVIEGAYKLSTPFESLFFNSYWTELLVVNRDISDLFKVDAQNGKLTVYIGFDRYEKADNGAWHLERNQDKGLLFFLNFNIRSRSNLNFTAESLCFQSSNSSFEGGTQGYQNTKGSLQKSL
ncbi:MAG: hypothetical protein AB8G05_01865 [Oligoflexales bacterium]